MRPNKAQYAFFAELAVVFIVFILLFAVGFVVLKKYADDKAKAEADKAKAEADKAAFVAAEAEKAAALASIDWTRTRNFRGTYWGMTKAQVKAIEEWPEDVHPHERALWYKGIISDVPSVLAYNFSDLNRFGEKTPEPVLDSASFTFYTFPGLKDAPSVTKAKHFFVSLDSILTRLHGPSVESKKSGKFNHIDTKIWTAQDTEINLVFNPLPNPNIFVMYLSTWESRAGSR